MAALGTSAPEQTTKGIMLHQVQRVNDKSGTSYVISYCGEYICTISLDDKSAEVWPRYTGRST